MSAAITAAVVVGGATIYGAKKAGDAADRAAGSADAAAQLQFEISQQQIDLANEQWDLYQNKIFPLEQQQMALGVERSELDMQIYEQYYAPLQEAFAAEAMEGIEAQPERAAREARIAVDQAFDTEEGMRERQLQRRGVRPGTAGAYESGMADTSLNRAAAKGMAVNRATEYEMDRVEDANFMRKATALGRAPAISGGAAGINANSAAAGLASAGNTAYGAGAQSANMAGMYGDATAGAVSGGIQLGMQAYDLFNRYSTPSPSAGMDIGFSPTSFNSYPAPAPAPTGAGGIDIGFSPTSFNQGGMVKTPPMLQRGYAEGGTVTGPPGYDQVPAGIQQPDGSMVPARLTNGEFVIPADVVAAVGTDPLEDIIEKARSRKQQRNQPKNALTRPGRA